MKRVIIVNRCNFVQKLAYCILLFLQLVNGYPTARTGKSIESEEKQFPNGSVIGKYAYLDKEGNPVQIKYYADDSSYGVELNSFRVVQPNKEGSASHPIGNIQQEKRPDEVLANIPAKENPSQTLPKGGSFDFIDTFKYTDPMTNNKYIGAKPYDPDLLHNEEKTAHQKSKYKNPDYEVYAKNDVESPPQCGTNSEKVRVYNFVNEARKEARKTRETPEEEQFCEF